MFSSRENCWYKKPLEFFKRDIFNLKCTFTRNTVLLRRPFLSGRKIRTNNYFPVYLKHIAAQIRTNIIPAYVCSFWFFSSDRRAQISFSIVGRFYQFSGIYGKYLRLYNRLLFGFWAEKMHPEVTLKYLVNSFYFRYL